MSVDKGGEFGHVPFRGQVFEPVAGPSAVANGPFVALDRIVVAIDDEASISHFLGREPAGGDMFVWLGPLASRLDEALNRCGRISQDNAEPSDPSFSARSAIARREEVEPSINGCDEPPAYPAAVLRNHVELTTQLLKADLRNPSMVGKSLA